MVSLFAQNQRTPKREAERLKTLAESLQKGGQYHGNEVVSGRVVKQSPLEHLARGLQTAAGGYFAGQSQAKADEDEANLQAKMAEALSQWGSDPQAAAMALAGDPRTSDLAAKIMAGELDYSRQKERWDQQDALQRELASMRASSGGSTPAAMQIANQMFELEQMMNNPEVPEADRFLAERQYNLLGQAAKTYGFDRGLQAGPMGGYQGVYGQPQMGSFGQVDMLPNGEMQAPVSGQPTPDIPLNPMQYQEMMQQSQFNDLIGGLTGQPQQPMRQDPMAAHAAAVQAQQQQIGVSPVQRPDLRSPIGMQEIQGYGQAAANIAAQKKAAEGRASEVGKKQGENENLYRSMVSRMPQLEDTVERLSRLGQAATYTMSGQAFNLAARELGLNVPDAATARAEYISMVDNEILPLLRDTFGAQFTQREGESLKATLGNPNVSPKEKDAVLRSFMRTKMESIESLRRELDYGESLPQYTPRAVNIGGQQYNPQAQQPQIAVNPQTGERLINRGNGWEPYNGN